MKSVERRMQQVEQRVKARRLPPLVITQNESGQWVRGPVPTGTEQITEEEIAAQKKIGHTVIRVVYSDSSNLF